MQAVDIVKSTQRWVASCVVDLNLCPFVKRELLHNRLRFTVTQAVSEEQLLQSLQAELCLLDSNSAIETTLLIHPRALLNFHEYNQFLDAAEKLLQQMHYSGIYQIATFHPDYQFANTEADAAENYTNRSPYPMLHLLREESLESVLKDYSNPESIPQKNIEVMRSLGTDKLQALLQSCLSQVSEK